MLQIFTPGGPTETGKCIRVGGVNLYLKWTRHKRVMDDPADVVPLRWRARATSHMGGTGQSHRGPEENLQETPPGGGGGITLLVQPEVINYDVLSKE